MQQLQDLSPDRVGDRPCTLHTKKRNRSVTLLPIGPRANGAPAFGQYAPDGDTYRPFALNVLELSGGRIVGMTTFLDATDDFPRFGLPARLRADEFPARSSYNLA